MSDKTKIVVIEDTALGHAKWALALIGNWTGQGSHYHVPRGDALAIHDRLTALVKHLEGGNR